MTQHDPYQPPYQLTAMHIALLAEIAEAVGRRMALEQASPSPTLRRSHTARSIHASLAIENNTLSLAQVTAVIDGKPVLGHPREIQEVRNALKAYEAMAQWHPDSEEDLLTAHRLLMQGLHDEAGHYRSAGVGIYRAEQLMHLAPPAERVPYLMADLLKWLETTDSQLCLPLRIRIHPSLRRRQRQNRTPVAKPTPVQMEAIVRIPARRNADPSKPASVLPRAGDQRSERRCWAFYFVHAACDTGGRAQSTGRADGMSESIINIAIHLFDVIAMYTLILTFLFSIIAFLIYISVPDTPKQSLRFFCSPHFKMLFLQCLFIFVYLNIYIDFSFEERILRSMLFNIGLLLIGASWTGALGISFRKKEDEKEDLKDMPYIVYFEEHREDAIKAFIIGVIMILIQLLMDYHYIKEWIQIYS